MSRILAFAVALSLALAGSQVQAADEASYSFVVPPPTPTPSAPQDQAATVGLSRIMFALKPGDAWAGGYWAFGGNYGEYLNWEGAPVAGYSETFRQLFAEEARRAGFAVPTTNVLFEQAAPETDLQLGVVIEEMRGRFCIDCTGQKGVFEGAVIMTAEWQLYSPLERRVVATARTRGGYKTPRRNYQSLSTIAYEAFRENIRQLLGSTEYRQAVIAHAIPANAALTSGPIRVTLAPPERRPISEAARSVATIYSTGGHGSGFLISGDGHLLTNQHVVGDARYVKVRWPDGAEELGEVIRADRGRDVALVKTSAQGRAPLSLRRNPVAPGETVFAIGTPLDPKYENTVTRGVLSASRLENGRPFLQSDVTVNAGNSGGPLLDESGAAIGIAVLAYRPQGLPTGINLFIPIGDAVDKLALQPAG